MGHICILSGLEIPQGRRSKEHYLPKSRVPRYIANDSRNIFPAHKLVNNIKSNLMPCEWYETKFDLTYHALMHYNIRNADKEFLRKTLEHWEEIDMNPCIPCLFKNKCRSR